MSDSPTYGMTLAQRIAHVGGRVNAAGYIEFGSEQAVRALMFQMARDMPPIRQAFAEELHEIIMAERFEPRDRLQRIDARITLAITSDRKP